MGKPTLKSYTPDELKELIDYALNDFDYDETEEESFADSDGYLAELGRQDAARELYEYVNEGSGEKADELYALVLHMKHGGGPDALKAHQALAYLRTAHRGCWANVAEFARVYYVGNALGHSKAIEEFGGFTDWDAYARSANLSDYTYVSLDDPANGQPDGPVHVFESEAASCY